MIHPMIQFQQQNLTQTSINNVKNIMCLWDFELSTKSLTAEKKSAKLRTQWMFLKLPSSVQSTTLDTIVEFPAMHTALHFQRYCE